MRRNILAGSAQGRLRHSQGPRTEVTWARNCGGVTVPWRITELAVNSPEPVTWVSFREKTQSKSCVIKKPQFRSARCGLGVGAFSRGLAGLVLLAWLSLFWRYDPRRRHRILNEGAGSARFGALPLNWFAKGYGFLFMFCFCA